MAGTDLISEKQVALIRRLARERTTALALLGDDPAQAVAEWMEANEVARLDRRSASRVIDRLKAVGVSDTPPPPSGWAGPADMDWIGPSRCRAKCAKCGQWADTGTALSGVKGGQWTTLHRPDDPACRAPEPTGIDLSALEPFLSETGQGNLTARFAHPDHAEGPVDGLTRCKVRVVLSSSGWFSVYDAAVYGAGARYGGQRPGSGDYAGVVQVADHDRRTLGGEADDHLYVGNVADLLREIVARPADAMRAFGHLTGRCSACYRVLEQAESIAAGIGPVCAERLGL